MSETTKPMRLIKPEQLAAQAGPEAYFTGVVHVTPLLQADDPSCLTCGAVRFQPGARSAWHTHPKGQLLVVTEGSGLIQEWNKPVRHIQKGDVIWTPAGVKHWHGASPTSALTHTAIQEAVAGKSVDWLEKVTDAEYAQPAS